MTNFITQAADAMRTGGYTNFKEFADTAVAAGYVSDGYIDLAAFIRDGAPRANEEN